MGEFPAGAVNRAVSSHAGRLGLVPGSTLRTPRPCGRPGGPAAPRRRSTSAGYDVVGLVRLCKAGIALQVCQLRPDHDIVGVLLEPLLQALDVVQPFGWDRFALHRHHASSAHMDVACRATLST